MTHLKIYDGKSSWNDLLAHAYNSLYNYYENIPRVVSSGNEMFVLFSSDSQVSTGFFAKIHRTSVNDRDPQATFCTATNPCKANEGHCYHDQQCHRGLLCGKRNCPSGFGYANDTNCCYEHCNEWLDLENGVLTAPNYPGSLAPGTVCSWNIDAPHQNQSIKLQFLDFQVKIRITRHVYLCYVPNDMLQVRDYFTSKAMDYLRVFDGNRYRRNRMMAQFNGISYEISSGGPHMLIVLDSDLYQGNNGFKANIIFEEVHMTNGVNTCTFTNPCNVNEEHCEYDYQCADQQRCGYNNCPYNSSYSSDTSCCYDYCGQFLDMEKGTLEYMGGRDMDKCSWSITIASNQIITLEFNTIMVSPQIGRLQKYRTSNRENFRWMMYTALVTSLGYLMATIQQRTIFWLKFQGIIMATWYFPPTSLVQIINCSLNM